MATNPSGRARFLSTEVEKSLTDQIAPDKAWEVIMSESSDAFNFILSRAGFPTQCRALLEALIGASHGCLDWFTANDYEIGKRMLGGRAEGKKTDSVRKRVQRLRAEMIDWQQASGRVMVLYMPGGKDRDGNHPSKYKLPILTAASLAIEAVASLSPEQSHEHLQRVSKAHVGWLTEQGNCKIERFRRPAQTPETQVRKLVSTAINLLKRASQVSVLHGYENHVIELAINALQPDERILREYLERGE